MGIDEPNYAEQHQRYLDAHSDPVGDCFRTAVACLLEVPRDTVPHFADMFKDKGPTFDWWYAAIAYVEEVKPGYTLVCVGANWPIYENPEDSFRRVILTGKSPRGDWNHSVLADSITGVMTWDPYPGGNGVESQLDVIALTGRNIMT